MEKQGLPVLFFGLLHNRGAKKKKKKRPQIAVEVPQRELGSSSSSPDSSLEGRDASSKGGLAAPGTVLWHQAKNESWDPAENIEAAITASPGPSACAWCVVSSIPLAHSAGVSVAMRDNAMSVRKVTINHHMAACENAGFMFFQKGCATVWVKWTSWWGGAPHQVDLKSLTGAPVQNQCVSLGDEQGENHQCGVPSWCCLYVVCSMFIPVSILFPDFQQFIHTLI